MVNIFRYYTTADFLSSVNEIKSLASDLALLSQFHYTLYIFLFGKKYDSINVGPLTWGQGRWLHCQSYKRIQCLNFPVGFELIVWHTEKYIEYNHSLLLQVILFEIICAIFYTNLHELFCQFISWTNWVNSGKFW